MSDEYMLVVVDNGDGNGETLVRIWTDGHVDADYRPRGANWLPVQLQGGGVRLEDSEGHDVEKLHVVRGGCDQRGGATRDVLLMVLVFLTLAFVFVAGPAGNGWITW